VSIPSNSIEAPEVVWATPDDTLEQVRTRLESPEIEDKWRAHVLVRSDDGRYAAAPVFEIQPIVWQGGPPALQRPLRDLGLFHFQPGVEQDAVDLKEAEQLASQYGGWLVVLRDGQYTGLVEARRRLLRTPKKPNGAFDLFDELLPDSMLAQTELVGATLDTTVAKVAASLKAKRHPENAYIVVEMDDGSVRVIASRDLNDQVEQADGDLWGLPLRQFEPYLRGAETRERGTLSRSQALKLASARSFLVLTDQGKPVGLLTSRGVHRAADYPRAMSYKGLVYDLYNVPQALLSGYPPDVGPQPEPRFVNLCFEEPDQQVVERSQPLVVGHTYNLALNVGRLREDSLVDWGCTPGGPEAIIEPQEHGAHLYVSLFSQDFEIPDPTQVFRLPKEGDADPVRFRVVPLRRSYGADLATMEVCLYYRTYLVQTFQVCVEVAAAGETASNPQPQSAHLAHARTASFPDMETLPPRALSLTITRDSADRYRFTFLVDPDPEDEAAAARAMELSCYVRLTRGDLTHLITKARRQLYNVVRTFDLLQDHDVLTCRKATRALAQVGRQLFLKLFEGHSAQALKDWMETSLPDGSTIQIVDLAGDFVFPWPLIYSAQPWDDDKAIDVTKLWGWRYKLVLLTNTLLDTYRQARTEIATDDPLRVSVGMHERLVGAAEQKAFFADLNAGTGQRILAEILTNRQEMSQALAAADQDLYYFFCHGYTERFVTDIQLDADLMGHFARLAADALDAQSESIHEHLDDLFDVSDSWIRLTRGKIPLAMLKETVPDQFSRHPIVFLNMCESAQVLPSLSDGFVPFFIGRGARAVVGTECSMNTVFADDFARAFLVRFFQGEAVGDILLALRRQTLDQGNPLALAYTLYGDADLRLRESLLPGKGAQNHARKENVSQEQARQEAVDVLWDDDMDGLMLTLAARAQAEDRGLARDELQLWEPREEAFATDLEAGPEWTAKMVALGEKWWAKLEPELHSLLCNKQNAQHGELMNALQMGAKMLAVALAPALVAQVAALPAVAIVVATIAAKKIGEAGLETVCEMWSESLAGKAKAGEGG
jgi:hypothetical protein